MNLTIDRPALTRAFSYLAGNARPDAAVRARSAENMYPLGGTDVAAARRWYAKRCSSPPSSSSTVDPPPMVTVAQVLEYNLKQVGNRPRGEVLEPTIATERRGHRASPSTSFCSAGRRLRRRGGAHRPAARARCVDLDDPRLRRRIDSANRLTSEARRRAWADLDVDLMRNDPPWAPFMHINNRTFVSKRLGCFLGRPIYRVDLVALCKK